MLSANRLRDVVPNPCTEVQGLHVLHSGAPLLDNINDEILRCNVQVLSDGKVFYASFPEEGALTSVGPVTQAKFTSSGLTNFELACYVSGQNPFAGFNFDELDC